MENKAWQIREFKNLFKFSSLITRSFEINSIKNTKKKKKSTSLLYLQLKSILFIEENRFLSNLKKSIE